MTKIQMPEPVAWQIHPADYGIGAKGVYARTDRAEQVEAWRKKGWAPSPLITTNQAEDYATAKVREQTPTIYGDAYRAGWKAALEEAAEIARRIYKGPEIEKRIRALIPTE